MGMGVFGQPTPHLLGDGTQAAPAYSYASSPGTGFYWLSGSVANIAVVNGSFSLRLAVGSLGVAGTLYLCNTGLTNRVALTTPADGILRLGNAANSDFGRIQFGGSTVSFPSLKRAGTTIEFRLADDSGYSNAVALNHVSTSALRIGQSVTTINDGAGAAAGTLLNAPAAGNPTKWLPYDDNGTTRYIPAW